MKESASHVTRAFKNLFGSVPESDEIFAMLLAYARADQERVQPAILKLSEGDPDKLRHNINAAKIEYLDVLAWAEYPEQMKTGASAFNSSPEVIDSILKRDKEQYQSWLSEQEDT